MPEILSQEQLEDGSTCRNRTCSNCTINYHKRFHCIEATSQTALRYKALAEKYKAMLKQLEDAAKCTEMRCVDCLLLTHDAEYCLQVAAKTTFTYRDALVKIIEHKNEPDKMYLYAEKAEKMLKEETL